MTTDRDRIEAACRAFWSNWDRITPEHRARCRVDMSRALAAADAIAPGTGVPEEQSLAAAALERIAAAELSDPAMDDLTVPLAIDCARLEMEKAALTRRITELEEGMRDAVFAIETMRVQLGTWRLQTACDAQGIEDRARALLSGESDAS